MCQISYSFEQPKVENMFLNWFPCLQLACGFTPNIALFLGAELAHILSGTLLLMNIYSYKKEDMFSLET
jgi:hypothetical protein